MPTSLSRARAAIFFASLGAALSTQGACSDEARSDPGNDLVRDASSSGANAANDGASNVSNDGAGGVDAQETASPDASTLGDAGARADAANDGSTSNGPRRPFPQHAPYASGSIRPNHRTQAQLDDRVSALYREWKARYLVDAPNTSPRQSYVFYNRENNPTGTTGAVSCSEGQGYGMLLAAYMAGSDNAAREDFNALSRFYDAHRSSIEPALMGWQQVKQGAQVVNNPNGGSDSATDGDLDIAYAFFVADNQWGSTGAVDYRAKGLAMLHGISHGLLAASDKHLRLGDWVNESDAKWGPATRTSDFVPGHLAAFHAIDGTLGFLQSKVTTLAIANGQMTRGAASATGLLPDFMTKASGTWGPVANGFLEGPHDGDYHYNACRVPWRLGTYELTSGDRALHTGLTALNAFVRRSANENPHNIKAGYRVSTGTPGESYANYEDLSFTAPFIVSAAVDAQNQTWMNGLWDAVADGFPTASDVYFGNSIRLISLLVTTGNWWVPGP